MAPLAAAVAEGGQTHSIWSQQGFLVCGAAEEEEGVEEEAWSGLPD